jgi:hypothetical protein
VFKKKAGVSTVKGREFAQINSDDITGKAGQWTVMFGWPK